MPSAWRDCRSRAERLGSAPHGRTRASRPMHTEPLRYQLPPRAIVELLDAPGAPWLFLAPDSSAWLEVQHPPMPTLEEVARPFVRLAGLRIDPATHAQRQ